MPEEMKNKEQPKQDQEKAAKPTENESKGSEKQPAKQPAEEKGTPGKPEKKEAATKPEKTEKVRPANCAGCNKAFKHKIWYYRNGQYFCTKRCWKKFAAEKKKAAVEKATKEAQEKAAAEKAAKEAQEKLAAEGQKETAPEKPENKARKPEDKQEGDKPVDDSAAKPSSQ